MSEISNRVDGGFKMEQWLKLCCFGKYFLDFVDKKYIGLTNEDFEALVLMHLFCVFFISFMLRFMQIDSSVVKTPEVSCTYKVNTRRSIHSPRCHLIFILIISDRRDCAMLGASGLWLGTRTGADGIVILA
jgi:hypothetical protein